MALNVDTLKAFNFINLLLDNGYVNLKQVANDSYLYNIRTLPKWLEVTAKVKQDKDNHLSRGKLIELIIESFNQTILRVCVI